MRKKIVKVLCLVCTSMLLSTNCYAKTLQDYEEEKNLVLSNINTNEKKIDSLTENISTIENKIEKKNNDIVELKKYYKKKKLILSQKTNDLDYLSMFEKILSSKNLSEFINEINLSKTLMITQNKSLDNLSEKENILTDEYDKLLSKLENLKSEKENTLNEQSELTILKKELEDKITQMTIDLENKTSVNLSKDDIHYNSENLLEPSNLNVETLTYLLSNTGLAGLEQDYIDAEKEYGINALFLVGLCALESGWGTSNRAINDNNLTGFGVYSNDSIGINDNSKRGNIFRTASHLRKNYLTVGAIYYKGLSINSVNISYCVKSDWSIKINEIITNLIGKLK